ncbi:MAG: DUF4160 domain-containing protein [Bacteroides sp.]|nr:DUF4160 domain-containing protein [Bacteroides sp.]MCM1084826.1 DUF4160 domain-containing protein [Bacteroides sp.]
MDVAGNIFQGIKFYPYICKKKQIENMPTLFELFGMRFFFYSLEHLPVHVHVENGDGRAKIEVETLEVKENLGIKPKDIKRALQIVTL